jgi:phosphohistidine phosphatase
MANLILWRHAEAEDHSKTGSDTDRALTKTGHKDAAKMAKWLSQHLPSNADIFCSPAKRCLETAAALQKLNPIKIKVADFLSTDSTVEIIVNKVSNDDSSKTTLIIGHQPNLGLVITKLLGMNESACSVKKGAIWWLRQREVGGALQIYLFAVQHPDY